VLHDGSENWVPNLCVPGLVRLNAGDHPLKHVVTRFASERRQSNELQIRETGFKHNVRSDMEFNRILSEG
jgi:hypothetical protein